jgi:hypothetical protein
LIKKYSELCELSVSVVNILSQETRENLIIESSFAVMTFPFTPVRSSGYARLLVAVNYAPTRASAMCDCGACGNGNVLS